ncbi:MAG TPA: hypothetical protein VIG35_08310 [Gaiellaceae bacterium]
MPDPNGSGIDLPHEERDFDLSAASLRASSGDLRIFVDVLAERLDRALPGRVKVERRATRLLSKQKHVTAIELDLGETRYLLAAQDGAVETRCATAVRGIVLKSAAVSLDAWVEALLNELAKEAQTSEQARLALGQLLQG